jgi:hypothetical protein
MKISKAKRRAVAREMVYDCVISEIEYGTVTAEKIISCLGLDIDNEEAVASISDETISQISREMANIVGGILRRGKLAR